MDFISKCTLFIFFVTVVSFVAVEANNEENLPAKNENTLKTTKSYVGDLSISAEEGKSRVKRQFGGYYEPYYNRRRRPYPPIIFGGIGGFGGYGFGRGYGGRGFGGRGFGGRGFGGRGIGGRGIGGRGIGGRGIGGRGGIGGFGGGRGGGRG